MAKVKVKGEKIQSVGKKDTYIIFVVTGLIIALLGLVTLVGLQKEKQVTPTPVNVTQPNDKTFHKAFFVEGTKASMTFTSQGVTYKYKVSEHAKAYDKSNSFAPASIEVLTKGQEIDVVVKNSEVVAVNYSSKSI